MLVAAGLEGRPSREIADAYEAAFHADAALHEHPAGPRVPARHRAHPRDARARGAAARTWVTPTSRPPGTCTTRSRRSRATARCPGTRSTSSAAAIAASSSRTSATTPTSRSGRPPARVASCAGPAAGARASRAGTSSARRWPSSTSASVRHPHRRRGQRLPAPRGRDRAVGADRRRAARERLDPRRAPADERPEDVEVRRQLPADHRAGRGGHRPARVPLPVPDRALRPQAQLLRRVARGRRVRARVAPRRGGRARAGARRTGRGPRRPPCAPDAPPIDRRDGCRDRRPWGARRRVAWRSDGAGGLRSSRRSPTERTARRRHSPTTAGACTTRSRRPSTTTSTRRRRCESRGRRSGPAWPSDERRWLVLDMDLVLGLDLDRAAEAARRAAPARRDAATLPDEIRRLLDDRSAARAGRDFARADRLREQLREFGVEPIDNADGSSDWRRLD